MKSSEEKRFAGLYERHLKFLKLQGKRKAPSMPMARRGEKDRFFMPRSTRHYTPGCAWHIKLQPIRFLMDLSPKQKLIKRRRELKEASRNESDCGAFKKIAESTQVANL